ncbi:MAG: glycosyltransferase family 39 protein [Bacteroidota bacterium]
MSKNKKQESQAVIEPNTNNLTFNISNFKFTLEEKICLGLLLLLILTIYIIRSNFLYIPFERDEGIYGYYGKLLLEGKIPYKDFYEQKFPGLFYFYATMVYFFGDTVKGLHTGFMFLNIITIILIYFSSRILFNPISGIISATTFAFVSLTPELSGFTVQAEHGVSFFISGGLLFYALYNSQKKWQYNFLMGIFFGFAIMTKTSGLFLVLWGGSIIIIDFLFSHNKTLKRFIIQVSTYSIGVLLIIGSFFLLIYIKGSFNDMIFWTYEIPKNYVSKIPFDDGVKYFTYSKNAIIQNYKFFWYHSLLAVILCLLKTISWKQKFFCLTLLVFSFLTIVPGFYFYGHYWIQTIPGLSIVTGLTSFAIISLINKYLKIENLKYVYLGIFAILTYTHITKLKNYYFKPNYERILRTVYGNNPFPESMEVANWINLNAKPEDNIVLLGSEPQIYFYTKKKSPSRHAYFAAIVDNVPQHKEWQREFVKDVEKAKPKYLVYFNHPISLFVQPNTDKYVFEWANKYVNENFHLVGLVDMIEGQHATYLWREQINNYKPVAQNVIYVYERN